MSNRVMRFEKEELRVQFIVADTKRQVSLKDIIAILHTLKALGVVLK